MDKILDKVENILKLNKIPTSRFGKSLLISYKEGGGNYMVLNSKLEIETREGTIEMLGIVEESIIGTHLALKVVDRLSEDEQCLLIVLEKLIKKYYEKEVKQ